MSNEGLAIVMNAIAESGELDPDTAERIARLIREQDSRRTKDNLLHHYSSDDYQPEPRLTILARTREPSPWEADRNTDGLLNSEIAWASEWQLIRVDEPAGICVLIDPHMDKGRAVALLKYIVRNVEEVPSDEWRRVATKRPELSPAPGRDDDDLPF